MSSLIPFQFGNAPIRVVEIDGEPWFVGKDVATALGYADPTTAIRSHCRGVPKLHPIADSLGRTQEARVLNEANVLRLIVNSSLPAAEKFEAWVFEEVLPQIRRTGAYSPAAIPRASYVSDACTILESVSRSLNLAPSATLGLYHNLAGKTGHLDLLPAYAVDAPGTGSSSSEATRSLTELLDHHNARISARAANVLLEEAGVIETATRKSSRGVQKPYKKLTEYGLQFGKNLTTPSNPRETQPHYYESRFADLLRIIGADQQAAA